ncbi:MAG: cytochrome c [Bacteroidota bacterium]
MRDELHPGQALRTPSGAVGLVFPYFLGASVLLGVLYVAHLPDIGRNSVRPGGAVDSSAFVDDIPLRGPSVVPPVDVMQAGVPTPEALARGSSLYETQCASCHGREGRGDGVAAAGLRPPPRNFREPSGWTNGATVAAIYTTLEEGIVRNGMASFQYLSPADRFALAHHVRTLHPAAPPDGREGLQSLETAYGLSRGVISAGQIPVASASRILARESGLRREALRALAVFPHLPGTGEGRRILEQVAGDRERVLWAVLGQGRFPGSPEGLTRAVAADPRAAGFHPSVLRLERGEWGDLYLYFRGLNEALGSGGPGGGIRP